MFHVFKEQQGAQPQWKRIHKQESEGERQSGPGQAAFCGYGCVLSVRYSYG